MVRHIERKTAHHETWTVGQLLDWTTSYFTRRGLETPRLDAELLLAEVLSSDRVCLYTEYDKPLGSDERSRFRELVERRSRHEPVAYLTGRKGFYSLELEVGPGVLVPRPETEHLVDEGLRLLDGGTATSEDPGRPLALDLGTGSGCLAIALATSREELRVVATDASQTALAIARRNAERLEVRERIRCVYGDLFDPLGEARPHYDLIVSNPPYIASSEIDGLMADVRLHEPREALFDSKSSDGDGYGFYRAIAAGAGAWLVPGGGLAVEVGHTQAEQVEAILSQAGFGDLRRTRDYAGIDRVVSGVWNEQPPHEPE